MPRVLISIVVLLLSGGSLTSAQHVPPQPNQGRKITNRVEPVYPELARRMHVRGMVKLEATVRANGSVRSTKVLGGSPVLAMAAGDAVGKWKFEPTPNETTEVVEISFKPNIESQQ
jgi:TonB family protein